MQTPTKGLKLLPKFCLFFSVFMLGCSAYSYTASAIIYNAQIITMSDKGIISDGTIVIKDDKILNIGGKELQDKYTAPLSLDAKNNIVMPGMINAHTHIPMVAFRGLVKKGLKTAFSDYFFRWKNSLLRQKWFIQPHH